MTRDTPYARWLPITDVQRDGRQLIVGYAGWNKVYSAFCQSFIEGSGFADVWWALMPAGEDTDPAHPPVSGTAHVMRDAPTHYLAEADTILRELESMKK